MSIETDEFREQLLDTEHKLVEYIEKYDSLDNDYVELSVEHKSAVELSINTVDYYITCIRESHERLARMFCTTQYKEGIEFIDSLINTYDESIPEDFSDSLSDHQGFFSTDHITEFQIQRNFVNYIEIIDNIYSDVSSYYNDITEIEKFRELLSYSSDDDIFLSIINIIYRDTNMLREIELRNGNAKRNMFEKIRRLFFQNSPRTVVSEFLFEPEIKVFSIGLISVLFMLYSHDTNEQIAFPRVRKAITQAGSTSIMKDILIPYIKNNTLSDFISHDTWDILSQDERVIKNVYNIIVSTSEKIEQVDIKTVMYSIPKVMRDKINLQKIKGNV